MRGDPPDPLHDAVLAARLLTLAPLRFGGMVLRGASPARDALVAALAEALPCRRLPGHVDDERLLGGIDIAASLAAGKPVETRGLLAEAAGGVLIVPMAERMEEGVAGRLARALDERQVALVLLDDAVDADDAPPLALMERLAFHCDLAQSREWECVTIKAKALAEVAPLSDDDLNALAATAAAFGVHSLRPLIHAAEAARTHAGLAGRKEAVRADLEAAVRLVLAPRATQLPPPPEEKSEEQEPPPPPPESSDPPPDTEDDSDTPTPEQLEELLVEAAAASIPADLLAQLAKGNAPRRGASGTGQKRKSGLRGKPLGARPECRVEALGLR